MAKMYAWSTFRTKVNEWGMVEETIEPGEEVSKDKLKISDDEWDELIASGAVREEKYPDVPSNVAPAEAAAQEAATEEAEEEVPTATPAPAAKPTTTAK